MTNLNARQACRKVKILTNKSEKKAIKEYISICIKKGYLKDNKGVILLIIYGNPKEAEKLWHISSSLYYNFNGCCPATEYSEFNGYTILISRTDSNNRTVYSTDTVQIKKVNDCLKDIAGMKVIPYIPTIKSTPKYFEVKRKDGTIIMVEEKVDTLGNDGRGYFIDFYKNYKYKMVPSA